MGKLDGKVVLITGAASGIGRASAIRMAAEGAAVMCADIDLAGVRETAAMITEGGSNAAAALELDVVNEAEVQTALQSTVDELGGLDVIFNNAGIGGNEAGWDKTIAINLSGVYTACSTVPRFSRSAVGARSSTPRLLRGWSA